MFIYFLFLLLGYLLFIVVATRSVGHQGQDAYARLDDSAIKIAN
jgi:hypothetical protein